MGHGSELTPVILFKAMLFSTRAMISQRYTIPAEPLALTVWRQTQTKKCLGV
jgi:hypothetical protein